MFNFSIDLITSDLLWVVEGGMVCAVAMLLVYVVSKAVSSFFN